MNREGIERESLPLPTLLSQALVAFVIEFDNAFEQQTPHRTSRYGPSPLGNGPWLVSMAMWTHIMRYVPESGIAVEQIQTQAQLTRAQVRVWTERLGDWWGYVYVERGAHQIVRPTPGGTRAIEVWRPLTETIEQRWQDRFGAPQIDALRKALVRVVSQFEVPMPDRLPILGYGLRGNNLPPSSRKSAPMEATPTTAPDLPGLLSQALNAFTVEYEHEAGLSLAIGANLLRLLTAEGVLAKEIPRKAGVAKEAIQVALSFLEKQGYVETHKLGTNIVVRMTQTGQQAKEAYGQCIESVERRWQERLGEQAIADLCASLAPLVGTGSESPLLRGIDSFPAGWRTRIQKPETLPHYPMTTHRGGFPDGA